jgi:hypothetical protein
MHRSSPENGYASRAKNHDNHEKFLIFKLNLGNYILIWFGFHILVHALIKEKSSNQKNVA